MQLLFTRRGAVSLVVQLSKAFLFTAFAYFSVRALSEEKWRPLLYSIFCVTAIEFFRHRQKKKYAAPRLEGPHGHLWDTRAPDGVELIPCNAEGCDGPLVGLLLTCEICGRTVHRGCRKKSKNNCKAKFISAKEQSHFTHAVHQWVEACAAENLNDESSCQICGLEVTSSLMATFRRCLWCQSAVHSACFELKKQQSPSFLKRERCLLGPYSSYVLPPTSVVAKNTAKTEFLITLPPHCRPWVVFINSRSGGNQGAELLRDFYAHFNPLQVYDLANTKPEDALRIFAEAKHDESLKEASFTVVACGGDGTVAWVLSALDSLGLRHVPVAPFPLGTGNDLARSLNWGGGYDGEPLYTYFHSMGNAHLQPLDRWNVHVDFSGNANNIDGVINNYFGIGLDAKVALGFHNLREARPSWFRSRLGNKLWYTCQGVTEFLERSCVELHTCCELSLDGEKVDLFADKFRNIQGIIVINIQSYAGGIDLWDNRKDPQSSMDDGYLEVVGVEGSYHMGKIHISLDSSLRIGQCRTLRINTHDPMPIQLDGEPQRLKQPSTITITHRNNMFMLAKSVTTHDRFKSTLKDGLEAAERQNIIDKSQQMALLSLLTRRLEASLASTVSDQPTHSYYK